MWFYFLLRWRSTLPWWWWWFSSGITTNQKSFCVSFAEQILTSADRLWLCFLFLLHTNWYIVTFKILSYCHISSPILVRWHLVCSSVLPQHQAPSFSFNLCFYHVKLTAALWSANMGGEGLSEWKGPMRAACMVLRNWLRSVLFKGPLHSVSWFVVGVDRHREPRPSGTDHAACKQRCWLFEPWCYCQ